VIETKHSPEPWKSDDDDSHGGIVDASGNPVCWGDDYAVDWRYFDDKSENRRRVLTCVNACAGIPTEALESERLDHALHTLTAVLEIADHWDAPLEDSVIESIRAALRALGRLK
jgi:hypothetical protein